VKLIRSLNDLPNDLCGGAVSIGNFDGVHRGHARIVQRLITRARELDGAAVVVTFDPHPVRLLRPDAAPPPLTWTDRKADLLAQLGVDTTIAYPTDEALLSLTPAAFFDQIVRQRLEARAMVEGPNFFFGHGRTGNVNVLGRLCDDAGIVCDVVEPIRDGDEYISSSMIRRFVARGDMQRAAELLTQPYRIRGMVTHGVGRGAKIGFPTANIDAIDTLLPALGVYAGRARIDDGIWPAAVNVGPSPTFGEAILKVEAHLIDFEGSLYGRPIEVDFLARLREIRPFGSAEQLTEQLANDVEEVRKKVNPSVAEKGIL